MEAVGIRLFLNGLQAASNHCATCVVFLGVVSAAVGMCVPGLCRRKCVFSYRVGSSEEIN